MTAIEFLISKNILRPDYTATQQFPLNLTRDTHIASTKKLIEAMEEYAQLKVREQIEERIKALEQPKHIDFV